MWLQMVKTIYYESVTYSAFVFTQGKAGFVSEGSNSARDCARAPLFSYVNENKLKSIDTYACKKPSIYINLLLTACFYLYP